MNTQNKIIIMNKNNLDNNNGLKNKYVYKFSNSQKLKGKISLASIVMPYSTPNIYVNNCRFTIRYNNINTNVVIPQGFYTIETLNYYLQFVQQQTTNNIPYNVISGSNVYFINILYNTAYYSVELRINPCILSGSVGKVGSVYNNNTPQVIITDEFNLILGLPRNQYFPPNIQQTPYTTISKDYNLIPNLSPSNVYNINCNIVNNNITIPSNVLYSFTPNTTYGSNINEKPNQLLFLNIVDGNYQQLILEFYNEFNQPLVILDENLIITIYLNLEE
jgi:hypothetical protein